MATIISEAEVAAALEEALAEHSGDMENSFSDHEEESHETKLQTIRYSFEPKNKSVEEIKDMNEYVLSYFESLNSMSRRIIAEQREVMAEQGNKWNKLTPEEQERLIDDRIAVPTVRKHYFVDETFSTRKPEWFPVLRLAHGISGSDRSVVNPRDSITSVTDYHSKDQFSSPWSWETRSQQDLRILGEGELETQLKLTIETDLKRLHLPAAAECKKKELNDVEIESKDSSQTDSIPGSEPLSRKHFLAVDFHGLKEHSSASSVQGSKSSLASSSSLPKGSKGTLDSTTPPKGMKANASSPAHTEDSKVSFSSSTVPKGSKTSLSSSSLVQTEPKPQKEDTNNQVVKSDNTKDLDLSTATNSSDFMALFQDW